LQGRESELLVGSGRADEVSEEEAEIHWGKGCHRFSKLRENPITSSRDSVLDNPRAAQNVGNIQTKLCRSGNLRCYLSWRFDSVGVNSNRTSMCQHSELVVLGIRWIWISHSRYRSDLTVLSRKSFAVRSNDT
jgi:hypothetical protein